MVKFKNKELFDLSRDISEKTNVIEQHPDVVRGLEAFAEKMRDQLGDTLAQRTGNALREPSRLPVPPPRK